MTTANDNHADKDVILRSEDLCQHPAFGANAVDAILAFRDFTMKRAGRNPTYEELTKLLREVVRAHTDGPGGIQ